MTGLATIPQAEMTPLQVAEVFVQSGMFPDAKSVATAASKLIVGRGLGLNDYDSMAGLHIIKGKVVLAANTMAAAIKSSGKYDYRAKTTETECSITFFDTSEKEKEEIGTTTFSIEDANKAGLRGDNWSKWPKAMLFARAISSGYREHCPDALGSAPVYVHEHGESEIPEDPKSSAAPQRETPQIGDPTPSDKEDDMPIKEKLVHVVSMWCDCDTKVDCFEICKQILKYHKVPIDGTAKDSDLEMVLEWIEDHMAEGRSLVEAVTGSDAFDDSDVVISESPKSDEEDPWGDE